MIDKAFILAGHAIFTVEPPTEFVVEHSRAKPVTGEPDMAGQIVAGCRSHYTYRITPTDDKPDEMMFACLLCGQDNERNYQYLAMVRTIDGSIFAGRNRKSSEQTWCFKILRKVLKAIWESRQRDIEAAGWKVHHVGQCGRCGRTLTTPESIESGFGPECRELIGI